MTHFALITTHNGSRSFQNTTDALQAESEHSQAVAKIPHTYNTKCGQAVAIARCAKLAWVLGFVFFLEGGGGDLEPL